MFLLKIIFMQGAILYLVTTSQHRVVVVQCHRLLMTINYACFKGDLTILA